MNLIGNRKKLMMMMFMVAVATVAQVNEKPFTVPELTDWKGSVGYARQDAKVVTRKEKNLPSEAYRLKIEEKRITLSASDRRGFLWGQQTLAQLREQGPLPQGEALDVPQYRMRGVMLDVGRKFVPIHYLRNLVRIMSYHKMNTLHLHLNDKADPKFFGGDWDKTFSAFRLECDTYPGLAAKDGFYTKREFIDLQLLADSLGVEIIPEIDSPSHALAFTQYRRELGSKEYGMDHFELSNPNVYTFMDALFKEYLGGKNPVFIGPRVNIGTDEYSNRDQEVVELFRKYTDYYLALIQSYGKQPALWGALTHAKGKTPVRVENVLMCCWYNRYAQPDSMMSLGYQVVSIPDRTHYIVPAAGYYRDYLDCQYIYNNWTPAVIADKKFKEQHPQIEGGMFALWNDIYGNGISTKDIHHRLFPSIQTVSTKCWTGQLTTFPYNVFDQKRLLLSEAPGINELGRLTKELTLNEVKPGENLSLPLTDVGYDYAVEFDVDCQPEERGAILSKSPYATFYLSDPERGQLGFSRDGYLMQFNYRLPRSGTVKLRIEGTNQETRLFVNGRRQQVLGKEELYCFRDPINTMPGAPFHPLAYRPSSRMYYVQTLFFPLEKGGNFKSKVTNLIVRKL